MSFILQGDMSEDFQNWNFLASMTLPYSGARTSMPQKASTFFRLFSFYPVCWDCSLISESNIMKFCMMWRLIQYNPPLEWTRSKKNFTCVGECWVWLRVVLQQPPPLPGRATRLPWGDTIWDACKTLGQLSSLFSLWLGLECLSPKHLSQIYQL